MKDLLFQLFSGSIGITNQPNGAVFMKKPLSLVPAASWAAWRTSPGRESNESARFRQTTAPSLLALRK
jgi:hypothetical protein